MGRAIRWCRFLGLTLCYLEKLLLRLPASCRKLLQWLHKIITKNKLVEKLVYVLQQRMGSFCSIDNDKQSPWIAKTFIIYHCHQIVRLARFSSFVTKYKCAEIISRKNYLITHLGVVFSSPTSRTAWSWVMKAKGHTVKPHYNEFTSNRKNLHCYGEQKLR